MTWFGIFSTVPESENFSHVYSSRPIDDPVFRKALGGEGVGAELQVDPAQAEYPVGFEFGGFGGATLVQTGQAHNYNRTCDINSQYGGVIGVKGGYTWSGIDAVTGTGDGSPAMSGQFAVLPSLEGELFETAFRYKASGTTFGIGTQMSTNLDIQVLSVDPTLKFQLGRFRPYVGIGLGAAYVRSTDPKLVYAGIGAGGGRDTDEVSFAAQGLAGVEVFVARHWALSVDYKYLDILGLTNTPDSTKINSLGQHIATVGVHYYF